MPGQEIDKLSEPQLKELLKALIQKRSSLQKIWGLTTAEILYLTHSSDSSHYSRHSHSSSARYRSGRRRTRRHRHFFGHWGGLIVAVIVLIDLYVFYRGCVFVYEGYQILQEGLKSIRQLKIDAKDYNKLKITANPHNISEIIALNHNLDQARDNLIVLKNRFALFEYAIFGVDIGAATSLIATVNAYLTWPLAAYLRAYHYSTVLSQSLIYRFLAASSSPLLLISMPVLIIICFALEFIFVANPFEYLQIPKKQSEESLNTLMQELNSSIDRVTETLEIILINNNDIKTLIETFAGETSKFDEEVFDQVAFQTGRAATATLDILKALLDGKSDYNDKPLFTTETENYMVDEKITEYLPKLNKLVRLLTSISANNNTDYAQELLLHAVNLCATLPDLEPKQTLLVKIIELAKYPVFSSKDDAPSDDYVAIALETTLASTQAKFTYLARNLTLLGVYPDISTAWQELIQWVAGFQDQQVRADTLSRIISELSSKKKTQKVARQSSKNVTTLFKPPVQQGSGGDKVTQQILPGEQAVWECLLKVTNAFDDTKIKNQLLGNIVDQLAKITNTTLTQANSTLLDLNKQCSEMSNTKTKLLSRLAIVKFITDSNLKFEIYNHEKGRTESLDIYVLRTACYDTTKISGFKSCLAQSIALTYLADRLAVKFENHRNADLDRTAPKRLLDSAIGQLEQIETLSYEKAIMFSHIASIYNSLILSTIESNQPMLGRMAQQLFNLCDQLKDRDEKIILLFSLLYSFSEIDISSQKIIDKLMLELKAKSAENTEAKNSLHAFSLSMQVAKDYTTFSGNIRRNSAKKNTPRKFSLPNLETLYHINVADNEPLPADIAQGLETTSELLKFSTWAEKQSISSHPSTIHLSFG